MTLKEAVAAAIRKATRRRVYMYVVYESGEFDTATEEDMHGYYFGAAVYATVNPSGEIEE